MKFRKLTEAVEVGNKMVINIGSGVNADGCTITITNEADEVLHRERYAYGYNASYNRKHAKYAQDDYDNAIKYNWQNKPSLKPFIGDIVHDLCAQYDIREDDIIYEKGKHLFMNTDATDADVDRFKSYLNESTDGGFKKGDRVELSNGQTGIVAADYVVGEDRVAVDIEGLDERKYPLVDTLRSIELDFLHNGVDDKGLHESFEMASMGSGLDDDGEIAAMRAEQAELEQKRAARKERFALMHKLFDKHMDKDPNAHWIDKIYDLFEFAEKVEFVGGNYGSIPSTTEDGQSVRYSYSVEDCDIYTDPYKDFVYVAQNNIGPMTEDLEDEFELLQCAAEYRCKLTRYDMEEASDYDQLLEHIKQVYLILKEEFGENLRVWRFYEDEDVDFGYKVWFKDRKPAEIVEIINGRVDKIDLNETYWIDNKDVMDEVSRLKKELQADGWKYYGDKYSGSTYYDFYMKRGDNGAICKAIQFNYDGAQVIDITLDQMMGYKPIDGFETMRRRLDKMLLPQYESFETNTENFPYMFFYNCNNPTFGYDFQLFASSLGAKKAYGRYKGTAPGSYFYLVPSEEVYNKLKEVAKSKYTVYMQRLLPYDAEKYPNVQLMNESASSNVTRYMVDMIPRDDSDKERAFIYADTEEEMKSKLAAKYDMNNWVIGGWEVQQVPAFYKKMDEDVSKDQYIICGITNNGTRVYYNSNGTFNTDVSDATIYDEYDIAMDDWFKIPRSGFSRIFIPVYDPAMVERVTEAFDADKVQKRIACTTEFDNGHVFHDDYFKASSIEAEERAKQASIDNPDKVFYVKYDDVMNPCSDIKWKNGEQLNECDNMKDNLGESIGTAVVAGAKLVGPKLLSVARHLPEILAGLDIVKELYDSLPEDNEVRKYLDGKGAKKVEDTYQIVSDLYKIINKAKSSSNSSAIVNEDVQSTELTQELINEINEYLKSNHVHQTVDVEKDPDSMEYCLVSEIVNGDWKHDHQRICYYINKFFEDSSNFVVADHWTTNYKGSDGDWYTATHWWDIESKTAEVEDEVEEPIYLSLLNKQSINESNTDFRFYVYDHDGNVVSDGYLFEDDAIEYAETNNYPIVKQHNYFYDTDKHRLEPDGDPVVVWSR